MEAPPPFDVPTWPDPNPDGTYTVTLATARSLLQLLGTLNVYIQTQYARCEVTP